MWLEKNNVLILLTLLCGKNRCRSIKEEGVENTSYEETKSGKVEAAKFP